MIHEYPPRQIQTYTELAQLMELIKTGECVFVGYQQPSATLAHGSNTFEVPIGYLIPGLLEIIKGE